MKAIYVDSVSPLRTRLYADSAVGRDNMPLFVPDLDLPLCLSVCVAVRIGRLGKHISEQFALRYVDAISQVLVLETSDGDEAQEFHSSGLSSLVDSMVTTGRWVNFDPGKSHFTRTVSGRTSDLDLAQMHLPEAISSISRNATLKSGDMLIFKSTAVYVDCEPGNYVTADLDGSGCLHLKVK